MEGEVDEHVEDLYKDLTHAIYTGLSPDAAFQLVSQAQRRLFSVFPEVLDARLKALERARDRLIEQQNRVLYLEKRALRFGREHWYLGPAEEGSLWSLLASRLSAAGRDDKEVELV